MSTLTNKYDMYEFIIEKMILRKMKEENDAINCSLKRVQEFIQTNGPILLKPTTSKKYSVNHTMEQKFHSYSSLSDYYRDMKQDMADLETELKDPEVYTPTYKPDSFE